MSDYVPGYQVAPFPLVPQPKTKPKLLEKRAVKADEGKAWRKARIVVLDRDKHVCRACGSKHGLDVHHVVMRSLGGSDEPENLIALCRECHQSVHGHVLKLRPLYANNPQKNVDFEWVK
jgi:5-methylcytosine-specific restriction endonuclease McrA